MVHFGAFGCHNKSDRRKSGQRIRFFSFPKDKSMRNSWITLTKRKNYTWKPTHNLCSDHFTTDQYKVNPEWMAKHGYPNALSKLKLDALPKFTFPDSKENKLEKSRGAFMKRRKKEVNTINCFINSIKLGNNKVFFSNYHTIFLCECIYSSTVVKHSKSDVLIFNK